MRRIPILPRILAALLSLSLTLQNSAYALRQTGLEESDNTKKDLITALLSSNSPDAAARNLVDRVTQAVGLTPLTPLAAGAEEGNQPQQIVLGYVLEPLQRALRILQSKADASAEEIRIAEAEMLRSLAREASQMISLLEESVGLPNLNRRALPRNISLQDLTLQLAEAVGGLDETRVIHEGKAVWALWELSQLIAENVRALEQLNNSPSSMTGDNLEVMRRLLKWAGSQQDDLPAEMVNPVGFTSPYGELARALRLTTTEVIPLDYYEEFQRTGISWQRRQLQQTVSEFQKSRKTIEQALSDDRESNSAGADEKDDPRMRRTTPTERVDQIKPEIKAELAAFFKQMSRDLSLATPTGTRVNDWLKAEKYPLIISQAQITQFVRITHLNLEEVNTVLTVLGYDFISRPQEGKPFWIRRAAGAEERYPEPVWSFRHPMQFDGTHTSFLNRHRIQWEAIHREFYEKIVAQTRESRQLKVLVLGAGTGEELARAYHEIVQGLQDLGEKPAQWTISIDGIEKEQEVFEEGEKRLRGESPFAKVGGDPTVEAPYIKAIIGTLNQHREVIPLRLRLHLGDIRKEETLRPFSDANLVLLNETIFHLGDSTEERIQYVRFLDQFFKNSWIAMTLLTNSMKTPVGRHHRYEKIPAEDGPGWTKSFYVLGQPLPAAGAEEKFGSPEIQRLFEEARRLPSRRRLDEDANTHLLSPIDRPDGVRIRGIMESHGDPRVLDMLHQTMSEFMGESEIKPAEWRLIVEGGERRLGAPSNVLDAGRVAVQVAEQMGITVVNPIQNVSRWEVVEEMIRRGQEETPPVTREDVLGFLVGQLAQEMPTGIVMDTPRAIHVLHSRWQGNATIEELYAASEAMMDREAHQREFMRLSQIIDDLQSQSQTPRGPVNLGSWDVVERIIQIGQTPGPTLFFTEGPVQLPRLERRQVLGFLTNQFAAQNFWGETPDIPGAIERALAGWGNRTNIDEIHNALFSERLKYIDRTQRMERMQGLRMAVQDDLTRQAVKEDLVQMPKTVRNVLVLVGYTYEKAIVSALSAAGAEESLEGKKIRQRAGGQEGFVSSEGGRQIRDYRIKSKMTQAEVSEGLEKSRGFMPSIERGNRWTSLETLKHLSGLIDLPVSQMLASSGTPIATKKKEQAIGGTTRRSRGGGRGIEIYVSAEIGERLRQARLREGQGMSQAEVARRTDGVRGATISRIENGNAWVEQQSFNQVANTLGLEPSSLIGGLSGAPVHDNDTSSSPMVSEVNQLRQEAARRVALEFEKASRLRQELEQATPSEQIAVDGIGPEQSSRHADALRVISQLMPGELRLRLFVITKTAAQSGYLDSRGLVASDQPYVVVTELGKRFGETTALRADYHATEAEQQVLRDAILLFGAKLEVIPRTTPEALRDFLLELLATLAGISPQSVLDQFNLDQLTRDIDLLIKA